LISSATDTHIERRFPKILLRLMLLLRVSVKFLKLLLRLLRLRVSVQFLKLQLRPKLLLKYLRLRSLLHVVVVVLLEVVQFLKLLHRLKLLHMVVVVLLEVVQFLKLLLNLFLRLISLLYMVVVVVLLKLQACTSSSSWSWCCSSFRPCSSWWS
jgi:hypothetical protein